MPAQGARHRTRSWSAFTAVRRLAAYYKRSPDLLSEEEVRDYVLNLRDQRGVARGTFKTNDRHSTTTGGGAGPCDG